MCNVAFTIVNADYIFYAQITNNHLYWTVTTILQEQSGTRRAEIVKHMIKIASVSSCLLSLSILLSYIMCYCR